MFNILLINGPNLNLLGEREPQIYGYSTLKDIEETLGQMAQSLDVKFSAFQSNSEGELVDVIQAHRLGQAQAVSGIIINPAAYTHTSIAIRDALACAHLPFIEVHLSQLAKREPFRQKSMISDLALGTLSGFGAYGYELALLALVRHLKQGI